MTQPIPSSDPDLWNYLAFDDVPGQGGKPTRILCRYGGNRTTAVDSQLIVSGIGAVAGNLRRNPSKFQFTMRVVTQEQMRDYERVLSVAQARGNQISTFRVSHPALHQLNVHELYLEGVTPLVAQSPGGELTSTWNLTERLPISFLSPKVISGIQEKYQNVLTNKNPPKPSQNPAATEPGPMGQF